MLIETMSENSYHIPVLAEKSVEALAIKPNGIYVDVTFGGGGHSKLILDQLKGGKLIAFDQDPDARQNALNLNDERIIFIKANFRFLYRFLRYFEIEKVDGILADLGISSHQIDNSERGFSTRFSGPLDMRMSPESELSALDFINESSAEELAKIFKTYAEIKNAYTAAKNIVSYRSDKKVESTEDLVNILSSSAPRGKEFRYYAQVFQAIRIHVNDEMGALTDFLTQSAEVLKPEGRLSVISYHSLEDRPVKNFINKGNFKGEAEKDIYGNEIKPLRAVNKKPIVADEEELGRNPRSRSAKLRIAEKIADL